MAKRRVVVTGMGAVTPIGLSVDEFWQNVKAQKTGFSEITKFDTTNYKCKLAAEVKEFDAKNYMDAKEARRMELFSQYAVAAAKEAIEDAGLEMDQEDPYMAGCAIGSGVGSLQAIEREHTRLIEKGPGRVGPLFVPMMISILGVCGLRIVWIYTIFQIPQYHTPQCLYLSYLVSWVITFIVQLAAFLIVFRRYLKTAE